jgi:hypothetical protein
LNRPSRGNGDQVIAIARRFVSGPPLTNLTRNRFLLCPRDSQLQFHAFVRKVVGTAEAEADIGLIWIHQKFASSERAFGPVGLADGSQQTIAVLSQRIGKSLPIIAT